MSASLPLHSTSPAREGAAPIRLGFAAEPIVELTGHGVLYSECLARMILVESVLLKAGDFVSGLEAEGSIGLLDAAMVDLVLDALADDLHVHLGCNVSPRTLADPEMWRFLVGRVAARPWLAPRLTIEITESAPLDEVPEARSRLADICSLGCRIAIDDFGAGYASSGRLNGLGIDWDIVKVDRSCFGRRRRAPLDSEALSKVVALASNLAPIVVVEGIETRAHLDAARSTEARYAQGWMFEGQVRERWSIPSGENGMRLAAAMMAHGAVIRPSRSSDVSGRASGYADASTQPIGSTQLSARRTESADYLLSRVDGVGGHIGPLAHGSWNGGRS